VAKKEEKSKKKDENPFLNPQKKPHPLFRVFILTRSPRIYNE